MDFIDAAVAALVAHLTAQVAAAGSPIAGNVSVVTAWPDFQAESPSGRGWIVVSAGSPDVTPMNPQRVSFSGGVAAYRVGTWTAAFQITFATWYKDTTSALVAALLPSMSQIPHDAGRTLTSTNYRNDPVRFVMAGADEWGPAGNFEAVWLRSVTLVASGHVLAATPHVALERVDADLNDRVVTITD